MDFQQNPTNPVLFSRESKAKIALCSSQDSGRIQEATRSIAELLLIPSEKELLLRLASLDVVILRLKEKHQIYLISQIKMQAPELPLLVYLSKDQTELVIGAQRAGAFEVLYDSDLPDVWQRVVSKALEWRSLKKELAQTQKILSLQKQNQQDQGLQMLLRELLDHRFSNHKEVVRHFSRILTASNDLNQMVHLSLTGLKEYLNVSRLALFLDEYSNGDFTFFGSLGMAERMASKVALSAHRGLAFHLAKEGIIIRKETEHGRLILNRDPEVRAELEALQCEFALPLLVNDRLVGILVGNNKVTGVAFTDSELEFLFSLCSQIAIGVENARLYRLLNYQNQYLACILNDVTSGVITIDQNERIVTFNPKAEDILGLSAAELLNQPVHLLPLPISKLLTEALREGRSMQRSEIQIGQRSLGGNGVQLKTKKNEVLGSVFVFADLSLIRQEEVMHQQKSHMDFVQKVAMRSSHELKNCLVSIRTFTQLLPDKYSDKEFRTDFYTIVNHEVDRLAILVDNLNFFAQEMELFPVKENIEAVIDEGMALVPKEDRHNIVIEKEIQLEDLTVFWDTENMKRAFFNIFRNSVQAMAKGGHLFVGVCEKTKGHLAIRILDDGVGVDEKECPYVFDPFFTTKSRGIGLGLTITKKIIEAHGGQVYFSSQADQGSRLDIMIPKRILVDQSPPQGVSSQTGQYEQKNSNR